MPAKAWEAVILCFVSWERVTTLGSIEVLRERRQILMKEPVLWRFGGRGSLLERLMALSGLSLENMGGDETGCMGQKACNK